jgi:hypothetical protein
VKEQGYTFERAAILLLLIAFPVLFLLKLGEVLLGVIFGYAGIYVIYRVFGFLRSWLLRRFWHEVAHALGMSIQGEREELNPSPDPGVIEQTVDIFVILLANTRTTYRLEGAVAEQSVRITAKPTRVGWQARVRVDCGEIFPNWLKLRKGRGPAATRQWFDVEDVLVGERAFDDLFLVRGKGKDEVRQFFVDHEVTDVLVELAEAVPNLKLEDGFLEVVERGSLRRVSQLVERIEMIAEGVHRLEKREAERVVADFDEQVADEEKEASVHVYE